jgi:hypothetical protein
MLLLFVMFVFFILHIQGLARFVLFGTSETTYYMFTTRYLYDRHVAIQSLILALACAGAFAFGYKLFYRRPKKPEVSPITEVNLRPYRVELMLFVITGVLQILTNLVLAFVSGLDYLTIVITKANYPFLFQSRMVFLVLLAHLLLNIPLRQIWTRRELRSVRWITMAYIIMTILLQFRSEVFEIGSIIAFSYLMWTGDRVKVKYVLLMVLSLLVPNLIVLGRLGFPTDPEVLMNGLFSFEYSTLFNNILSDAVSRGKEITGGLTFLPELVLIIPSPLRTMFGVEVKTSDYFGIISSEAGVFGGGFSFLGEMYSNFGWFAPLVFGMLGALIGKMNVGAARVGKVPVVYAAAPLLYEFFILAFRNDFGVFLKYAIQLFIVASLIGFVRRLRLVGCSSKLNPNSA